MILAHNFYPEQFIPRLILSGLDPSSSASKIGITSPFLAGWLLNLFGSLLRVRCYRILHKLFTFELSIQKNHALITSGPYSVVRHPSYAGAIIAGVGFVLCHLSPGSWVIECSGLTSPRGILGIWVTGLSIAFSALIPRMRKEDGMLRSKFGKEWEEWANRVRYRLVPGIY